jgi:hypothetical protein
MKGRYAPPLAEREVIAEAAQAIAQRPGLWVLQIRHDDWCETLRTGQPARCNCQPDQRLVQYDDLPRGGRHR